MDESAGLEVRAPQRADAEAIYQFIAAYNTALIGTPDVTLAQVVEGLTSPTFRAESDGWLVLHDGQVVGFGTVTIGGDGRHAQITPLATDVPVAAWLLEKGIRRAREAVDHPEVIARIGMHPQNEALRDLASSAGFELATTYHRMRIDHHGPLAAPEPPAKATLHRGAHDDTTRRAAHAVLTAAFSAQDGAAIRPYDEWLATHENRSGFDWSQLSLVEYDGQVVAASDCNHAFVETDNCGYVGRIGVLPEARGRGLAKYLLRQAFATDAAAGLAGTLLHVDTNNPTAALNLYLSVGMHADRESHLWEQVLQKQQPPGR